jgi:hypothetical protein
MLQRVVAGIHADVNARRYCNIGALCNGRALASTA